MSPNNNKESKLFRAALSAAQDCLSLQQLESVADGSSTNPQHLSHVRTCARCMTEIRMLRSFQENQPLPDEGAAVAWISAELDRRQSSTTADSQTSGRSWWQKLFSSMPKLASAIAAMTVIAVGVGVYQYRSQQPTLHAPSGTEQFRSNNIKLYEPIGDLAQVPQQFRWEPVAGVEKYIITVSEVDNKVIRTEQSFYNMLTIPETLQAKIHINKVILWQVTAFDNQGKQIGNSQPERFRIVQRPAE